MGLYAIGTSTTLESNKSHLSLPLPWQSRRPLVYKKSFFVIAPFSHLWSAILSRCSCLEPTSHHIPSRCVWRIINPVGQLSRWEHVDKVRAVAGDENMLARKDHRGNHEVSITSPPAMLLAQTFHQRRAGHVKHDDMELGEHLLGVQQALVGEGGFGRRRLQGRLTPSAEYFGDHHRRERDLGPRHPQQIQA